LRKWGIWPEFVRKGHRGESLVKRKGSGRRDTRTKVRPHRKFEIVPKTILLRHSKNRVCIKPPQRSPDVLRIRIVERVPR